MADEKALTIDSVLKMVGGVNDTDNLLVGLGIKSNSGSLYFQPFANSTTAVQVQNAAGTAVAVFDTTNSRLRVGDGTAPTARLAIAGGGGTIAPIAIGSGALTGAVVNGTMEYEGTHLYFSIGGTRYQLDQQTTGYALANLQFVTYGTEASLTNERVMSNGTGTAIDIATAGQIKVNLTSTGVGVGSYTYASITVDANGRITSASNGTTPAPVNAAYVVQTASGTLTGEFVLSNGTGTSVSSGAGAISVNLTNVGTAGTYNYPTQIITDANGRVTSVTGGSAPVSLTGYTQSIAPFGTALGVNTASAGAAGTGRVLIGYGAGGSSTSTGAVAVGYLAGQNPDGGYNVSIGYQALFGNASLHTAQYNVAIGSNCGYSLSSGQQNVFSGSTAGNQMTTGSYNTALGASSLYDATNALHTVAIGYQAAFYGGTTYFDGGVYIGSKAGYQLAKGTANDACHIAIGSNALYGSAACVATNDVWGLIAIGTGALYAVDNNCYDNVALGHYSLGSLTTGYDNVAVGANALGAGTSVTHNVAIGSKAGANATGDYCVLIGSRVNSVGAMSGSYNIAVGYNTANAMTTGAQNVLIGHEVTRLGTTVASSVLLGYRAGYAVAAGAGNCEYNVLVGSNAGANRTSLGLYFTAVGYQAGYQATGQESVAIGPFAMYGGATASACNYNTVVGSRAMYACTSSASCVAVGNSALWSVSSGSSNTAVGSQALYSLTTLSGCTAVGYQAGYSANAVANSLFGYQAGYNLDGGYNTAIGYETMRGNATNTADHNTAVGHRAMYSVSSGAFNVAMGPSAALNLLSGDYNIAIGYQTAVNATTVSNIIAIGYNALYQGGYTYSIAIGYEALYSLQYAVGQTDGNIAIGYQALRVLNYTGASTARFNTALGVIALSALTASASTDHEADRNTAVGYAAASRLTYNCSDNTALGYNALAAAANGVYTNVAIGSGAAEVTTGSANTAVGYGALSSNTSGGSNVAIGNGAMGLTTTASNCTAVGLGAWGNYAATSGTTGITAIGRAAFSGGYGDNNTMVGDAAGGNLTSGSNNTTVGYGSGPKATSSYNVCVGVSNATVNASITGNTLVGYGAGGSFQAAANYNVAVGYSALSGSSVTGDYCCAIGTLALTRVTTATGTIGIGYQAGNSIVSASYNIAIGYQAMYNTNTASGSDNIAIGRTSLTSVTAAYGNVAIGLGTLSNLTGATNGMYNVAVGVNAGNSITTGYYNVCIGVNSDASTTSFENIAIGQAAVATGASNCGQIFNGANATSATIRFGTINQIAAYSGTFNNWSDARHKEQIRDLKTSEGLAFIEALRPVSFYKKFDAATRAKFEDGSAALHENYGLIVQEVRQVMDDMGVGDHTLCDLSDPEAYSMVYMQLIAPLVKSVQELSQMVKDQQTAALSLVQMVKDLQAEVTTLKGS